MGVYVLLGRLLIGRCLFGIASAQKHLTGAVCEPSPHFVLDDETMSPAPPRALKADPPRPPAPSGTPLNWAPASSARLCRLVSFSTLCIGLLALTGWVFFPDHAWTLMQRQWVMMSPQAAAGFSCLALAFFVKNRQSRWKPPHAETLFLGTAVFAVVAADFFVSPVPVGESVFTSAALFGLAVLLLGSPYAKRWNNKIGNIAGVANLTLILGYTYFLIVYCHGDYVLPGNNLPCPRLLSVICTVLLAIAHLATLGTSHFPVRLFSGNSVRAVLLRKSLPVTLVIVLTFACVRGSMPPLLPPPLAVFLTLVTSTVIVVYLILRSSTVVASHLETALQRSEQNYSHLVGGLKDFAVFLLNAKGRILVWNSGAEDIIGYKASEVLGEPVSRVFSERKPNLEIKAALEQIELTGHFQWEGWIGRKNAPPFWGETSLRKLVNPRGTMVGVSVIIRDATQRRKAEETIRSSLREKEVMLKEIHHRVKNNLQVISSLLRLQAESIQDQSIASLFSDSQNRVQAMAMVHEQLYKSTDFSRVNFRTYVASLERNLRRTFNPLTLDQAPRIEVDDIFLSLDLAIPCGIILTELISNASKYAYPDRPGGPIDVRFVRLISGDYELSVADHGVGFPKGFEWRQADTLGLRLIQLLTEQIHGTLRLESPPGVKFTVTFKNETVS